MILSPRPCAHEHCEGIYIFPQGISPGEDNISIIDLYIYIYHCISACVVFFVCLFVFVRLALANLPICYLFYISGSSRFGYLSVDLSIDLLIYLLFYLLVY